MLIEDTRGPATYRLIKIIKQLIDKGPYRSYLTYSEMMQAWLDSGERASDFNRQMVSVYRSIHRQPFYYFYHWKKMGVDEIFARM